MPGSKQACPKVAACWSPAMPAMRHRRAEQRRRRSWRPDAARVDDARQQRARDAEQPSNSSSQSSRAMSKSAVRAALLTSLRCSAPAGELPHQPAVDRAAGEFAALGAFARARHVVEQPGELGGRKVRVEQQAGALLHHRLGARGAQCLALRRRAPVLPHDRRRNRTAGGAFPDQRGLALVGDADRGKIGRRQIARAAAPRARNRAGCARSRAASCSTQPDCGYDWRNSCCALARAAPCASNTIARELVVPWSSARMNSGMSSSFAAANIDAAAPRRHTACRMFRGRRPRPSAPRRRCCRQE